MPNSTRHVLNLRLVPIGEFRVRFRFKLHVLLIFFITKRASLVRNRANVNDPLIFSFLEPVMVKLAVRRKLHSIRSQCYKTFFIRNFCTKLVCLLN